MSIAKVVKVTKGTILRDKEIVLYQNNKFRKRPIYNSEFCKIENTEERASKEKIINLSFFVKFGNKIFDREYTIKGDYHIIEIPKKKRRIIKTTERDEDGRCEVHYAIELEEYKDQLIKKIKEIEKDFYLKEEELIELVFDLIKGKYKWQYFKTNIKVGERIIDAIAFVDNKERYSAKIIGFEIKTDRDSYERLFGQIDDYLMMCDEVYLVVQNKSIPKNLPHYVGVIKAKKGNVEVIRKATTLRHSLEPNNLCWVTSYKRLKQHIGIKDIAKVDNFFNAVENIKRKIIFNQYVIGFNSNWGSKKTYKKPYIDLTEREKNIVRAYFGKEFLKPKTLKELENENSNLC